MSFHILSNRWRVYWELMLSAAAGVLVALVWTMNKGWLDRPPVEQPGVRYGYLALLVLLILLEAVKTAQYITAGREYCVVTILPAAIYLLLARGLLYPALTWGCGLGVLAVRLGMVALALKRHDKRQLHNLETMLCADVLFLIFLWQQFVPFV